MPFPSKYCQEGTGEGRVSDLTGETTQLGNFISHSRTKHFLSPSHQASSTSRACLALIVPGTRCSERNSCVPVTVTWLQDRNRWKHWQTSTVRWLSGLAFSSIQPACSVFLQWSIKAFLVFTSMPKVQKREQSRLLVDEDPYAFPADFDCTWRSSRERHMFKYTNICGLLPSLGTSNRLTSIYWQLQALLAAVLGVKYHADSFFKDFQINGFNEMAWFMGAGKIFRGFGVLYTYISKRYKMWVSMEIGKLWDSRSFFRQVTAWWTKDYTIMDFCQPLSILCLSEMLCSTIKKSNGRPCVNILPAQPSSEPLDVEKRLNADYARCFLNGIIQKLAGIEYQDWGTLDSKRAIHSQTSW